MTTVGRRRRGLGDGARTKLDDAQAQWSTTAFFRALEGEAPPAALHPADEWTLRALAPADTDEEDEDSA